MHISRYSIWWRKLLHKVVAVLIGTTLEHSVKLLRNAFVPNGKPTLYATTHVFFDDVGCALSTIKDQAFLLFGRADEKVSFIERIGLCLNGYVPVRRWDMEYIAGSVGEKAVVGIA